MSFKKEGRRQKTCKQKKNRELLSCCLVRLMLQFVKISTGRRGGRLLEGQIDRLTA